MPIDVVHIAVSASQQLTKSVVTALTGAVVEIAPDILGNFADPAAELQR